MMPIHRRGINYNVLTRGSLRALVAKRDWAEIEEIAKIKKSPIGWEVCFTNRTKKEHSLALNVPRLPSLRHDDMETCWMPI